MINRLKKWIVTTLLVGAIVGSTSALSYAAGFWNYTPHTVYVHFTSESCPWALRWACGTVYALPPHENGVPGSASTNNTRGTVSLGGSSSNLMKDKDGYVKYSHETLVIEIGPQDYINFALEHDKLLRIRIHRSDTNVDEIKYLRLEG